MSSNFDRTMALIIVFGIAGAFMAGEVGALTGCILGIGLGILLWHKHDWQKQPLYDAAGEPMVLLKFCECGETQFNGWFAKNVLKEKS
ncbi:hypothetical protein ES703_108980 [subsurface metagenome]